MSRATFICFGRDRCDKHNRPLVDGHPCCDCQDEWRRAHPKTAEAIARFASGRGSKGAVDKARREDAVSAGSSLPKETPK